MMQLGTRQKMMVQGWTETMFVFVRMVIDFACSTVICAVPLTLGVS